MDENSEKIKSIILDTNIIFSSIAKKEGYTQAVLSILLPQKIIDLFAPSAIKTEINAHLPEISRKSGLSANIIREVIAIIFKYVKTVEEEKFKKEITEAFDFVYHKKDAPFAGLAMKYSPSIILTYNKQDFKVEELKRKNVLVFEPKELIKYFDLEIKLRKKVKKKRGMLKLLSKLYILKSR